MPEGGREGGREGGEFYSHCLLYIRSKSHAAGLNLYRGPRGNREGRCDRLWCLGKKGGREEGEEGGVECVWISRCFLCIRSKAHAAGLNLYRGPRGNREDVVTDDGA